MGTPHDFMDRAIDSLRPSGFREAFDAEIDKLSTRPEHHERELPENAEERRREVELEERIREVLGWREILLSDDEEAKRELIESLDEKDLPVALSAIDPLSDGPTQLCSQVPTGVTAPSASPVCGRSCGGASTSPIRVTRTRSPVTRSVACAGARARARSGIERRRTGA
jgi:hypothetical protein